VASSRLKICPLTRSEAKAFIARHHRHNRPPSACIFQIGVRSNDVLVGVAMVGRPLARKLCDGVTLEVLRCCTDGTRNACSILYAASARAGRALGYEKIITYTLESEIGTSLRASGWDSEGKGKGGKPEAWGASRQSKRTQTIDLFGSVLIPPGPKQRWSKRLSGAKEMLEGQ